MASSERLSDVDQYFQNQFNTHLSQDEETAFRHWAVKSGRNPDLEVIDYDLRGAWKELMSGNMTPGANNHLGDKYKKPNHPTFSVESKYHGAPAPFGGVYEGGEWIMPKDASSGIYMAYRPSLTMLKYTHHPERMKSYFDENEPSAKLLLPSAPYKTDW